VLVRTTEPAFRRFRDEKHCPKEDDRLVGVFRGQGAKFAASDIHRELGRVGARLSLATIYNTLNSFSDAGMLKKITLGEGNFFYDTNPSEDVHLVIEDEEGAQEIKDVIDMDRAISDIKMIAKSRSDISAIRIVL